MPSEPLSFMPLPPPSPPPSVSDLILAMVADQALSAARSGSPESPGTLAGSLLGVPSPVEHADFSRPLGRIVRVMVTVPEYRILRLSESGVATVPGAAVLSRLGLPAGCRVILEEPRLAAGVMECIVEHESFEEVYFGQAAPIRVVVPAPAASPPIPREARPAPEGVS